MIHGGDVYSIYEAHPSMTDRLVDFSANISPLGMPEAIKTAAVRALSEAECYPDPKARDHSVSFAHLRDCAGSKLCRLRQRRCGCDLPACACPEAETRAFMRADICGI